MMAKFIDTMDEESRRGRFGWFSLGDIFVPYIHRGEDDTRYCSVRVVDRLVMARTVELLPQQVIDCALVEAELMTDPEIKLHNDINSKHMDYTLGKHLFNTRDKIVRVDSLVHFLKFLTTCVKMLSTKETLSSPVCDWCGFLRLEVEGEVSDLPYVILDQKKYVPLFYLEATTGALRKKAVTISGWDFSYLVFLTCVAGVRQELMQLPSSAKVVCIEDVLLSLPSSTTVEEYWPHHHSLLRPATTMRPASVVGVTWTKVTPMTKCPPSWLGKLIAVKDFPLDPLHTVSGGDYKLVTARLPGQMEVEAVNIRPGVTSGPDLMVCLQDLARALSPSMEVQQVYTVLIALGVCLYTPNTGQTMLLQTHGKCQDINPPPTVLVRDLLKHMDTLQNMVAHTDKGEGGL